MTLSPAPAEDASHPLVQRLVAQHGARWVDADNLADFVAAPSTVLLLVGDTHRHPEALDVAVVLPELARALPGQFAIGVARTQAEQAIAARFGSREWPALLFFRDGRYATAVTGMHGWTEYVDKVGAALAAAPSTQERLGLPVVSDGANEGSSCH